MNAVADFDAWVDRHAALLRNNKAINRLAYLVTESANHSLLWHAVNLALLLTGRRSRRDAFRLAVLLGIESALVNGLIKRLFRRERPVVDAVRPHRLRKPKTTSFPSGHATSAFCAASILGDKSGPIGKIGWFSLAKVVAWTRIHVQIHHASDVAGGALLGLVFAKVANALWPGNR